MKSYLIHIIICIFFLIGCIQKQDVEEIYRYGGEVKIALNSSIEDLFPFTTDEYNVEQIHKYMLSPSFVKFDENGIPQPDIAGIWKTDESNLSVTFILNQNFFWSNGIKVSTYDVKYTLDLINKFSQFKNSDLIVNNIKEFNIHDSTTCSITYINPVAEPLYFTNFPIFPAQNNYDTTNIENFKESYFNNFIGCGPFIISTYTNDSLIFIKNQYYPNKLPYLQKVVFTVYNNYEQFQNMLNEQEIEFAPNLPVDVLTNPEVIKNFEIKTYPEMGYTFIAWNLNSGILKNIKMRTALSHAIDRQTLIDGILAGYAEVINGPMYFNKKGDENLHHPEFNLSESENLLSELGWKNYDAEGFRTKSGERLSLSMLVNKENKERIEIAKNIMANLRLVGVDLRLKLVSWKELLRSINSKKFDAVLVTWTDNDYYDPSLLFHSKAIENGVNFMSYKSDNVDSLIENALFSWNKNQKDQYWSQFRQQIAFDLPCTFLFSQKIIVAYNKKIKNVLLDSRGYLVNIKEWWIQ